MHDGTHTNLPVDQIDGFELGLRLQAEAEGFEIDIISTDPVGGLVDISWVVSRMAPAAQPKPVPAPQPAAPKPLAPKPQPAPAAPASGNGRFVSASRTADLTIVYVDAQGSTMTRLRGSRSWRNNNPGNISAGKFTDGQGAIGDDGRFAIFPDEATGLASIVALLSGPNYQDKTLAGAITRYAPPSENPTETYIRSVSSRTGIDRDTPMSTLSHDDLDRISVQIQRVEGWKPGTETA